MNIPLDQVVDFDVITSSPETAAVVDADALPSFAVFEQSTDTDIGVGGAMTKRTGKTGNYRGSFTASAANGFELGKFYNVVVSATVAGIAAKTVAMRLLVGVAAGGVIITPILASAANPRISSRKLATIPQGTAPTDLVNITDATGTAVDLSGMTLRMVVAIATDLNDADDRTDDLIVALYKYEMGTGLTVQGTDSNQIKIQHNAANTALCGKFRYWVYDVAAPSQPIAVLKGTFDVEPAATNA